MLIYPPSHAKTHLCDLQSGADCALKWLAEFSSAGRRTTRTRNIFSENEEKERKWVRKVEQKMTNQTLNCCIQNIGQRSLKTIMKGVIKRRAALGDTAIAFEIRECTSYNTTVSGSVFASSGTRRLGNLCLFHPKMLLTISYKDCHHCFFQPNHAEVRGGARTHRNLL